MLFIAALTACTNDRYLNHPVYVETAGDDTATRVPMEPEAPPCDEPMFEVNPTAVDFFTAITPWEDDVRLRTDTQEVTVRSLCDADLEVVLTVSGGDVGRFAAVEEHGDRNGTAANAFIFSLLAGASNVRSVTYTAGDDAALVGYDEGLLTASAAGFVAEAGLDATIINATFSR